MITFSFPLKSEFKLLNKQTLEDFDSEVEKDYAKGSDSISLVALWMT